MALKHSYRVLATLYDLLVRGPLDSARRRSLARIEDLKDGDILINGIGTGLDLPYMSKSLDIIIMYLIPAVVPEPERALLGTDRVLKKNGTLCILDKLIKSGQIAAVRRGLNTILRHIATGTDVVFEDLRSRSTQLFVVSDEPALAGGWFRLIELVKKPG